MHIKHTTTDEERENLIQKLLSKYLPFWPVFLGAIFLALIIAYTYIRYTIPVYEATATLIIKDERKGNEESKLMESLDLVSSKKTVENEIEVIQSRKLMYEVVKKLHLYAPIIEHGRIKDVSAYTKSPVKIQVVNPDSLKEAKKIKLLYNGDTREVILNDKYKYPLNKFVATPSVN